MAPIGDTLRAAREEKGLALERAAEETNIARRYLAALEAEEFSVFPGEPYALGFLRNYAEYLGLSSDELVASYRNLKIQEQPVPIQELLPARRPSPLLVFGLVAGVLVAGGVGLGIFLAARAAPPAEELAGPDRVPVEYLLDGDSFEKRFFLGDALVASAGSDKYRVSVAALGEALSLETPLGKLRLSLGEEGTVDFDKDGEPDLVVAVGELSRKDPAKGALLRFSRPAARAAAPAAPPAAPPAVGAAAPGAQASAPPVQPAAPLPPEPAPSAAARIAPVFEAAKSPYPFVVSVTFRGPSMFRYEVDRRDREERYYHKGETITINANNAVKLWASNALSAKVVVQASGGRSADVDLGGAGEVAVKRIAWSQGEGGAYTLNAIDVD